MSEEEDATSVNDFIDKVSDVTLLLNKISPYVEKLKGKLVKELFMALIISVSKLSNDFRTLLKYMNIMQELDLDSKDAPDFESLGDEEKERMVV